MDVYVTLAFGSRRKNGPDFYVVMDVYPGLIVEEDE
jgi:hypothetical protein